MHLIVDFGNTTGKAGLFEGDRLIRAVPNLNLEDLSKLEKDYAPEHCMVSSTGIDYSLIRGKLQAECLTLNDATIKLPFGSDYKTMESLGHDRIAAVAGAQWLFPNEDCLIIDMGTCITYDLLTGSRYKGGGISPGLHLRFRALNAFTARLPLVTAVEEAPLTGDSTQKAILSGVINGISAEIDGIIGQYRCRHGNLRVVLCGGDYIFFENKLRESIFAIPELVLKGLNGILLHNVL